MPVLLVILSNTQSLIVISEAGLNISIPSVALIFIPLRVVLLAFPLSGSLISPPTTVTASAACPIIVRCGLSTQKPGYSPA